ncbi:MAG: cobalamin B12-binding domain-containing protein, partial [Candidatus Lokiarchaeota archaeon]|nr:cobalamin B12-binding domain-containing protein [Candidatus Lokiarchaeota archaeon]
MATKVLFIYPALPYDNPVFEHEIPIHLIHLANFLMDRVIPKPVIEVLDLDWERYLHAGFNPFDIEHVERVVKDEIDRVFTSGRDDRLFVLVSCFFTYQYLSTKTLLQAIKNLRDNNSVAITKVILGGYHPTILPADFNGLGVDCLIR